MQHPIPLPFRNLQLSAHIQANSIQQLKCAIHSMKDEKRYMKCYKQFPACHASNQKEHSTCSRTWKKHGNKADFPRSEEHTSELQSRFDLVCRLLLEKKN